METALLAMLLSLVGMSLAGRLPYIIGGNPVYDATRWPWQGSLQYYSDHSCGCSLISTTWAVTAAHCVPDPGSTYTVRFGSTEWSKGGKKSIVTQVITHERYGVGKGFYPNDIAVMKFASVILSDTVQPIPLATTEQAGNTDCWTTGWGYTTVGSNDDVLPENLQEARVSVYSQAVCEEKWGNNVNPGHVCVGEPGKSACNGDSGGPLVCAVGGAYQLVGVTSWVIVGCYPTKPSVYSRMDYFRDWVHENTGV